MIRKTIYKYQIPLADSFVLKLPETAKIIKVASMAAAIYMWCEHYTEVEVEERHFAWFGTGFDLPKQPIQYIETIFANGFVWHLYELTA